MTTWTGVPLSHNFSDNPANVAMPTVAFPLQQTTGILTASLQFFGDAFSGVPLTFQIGSQTFRVHLLGSTWTGFLHNLKISGDIAYFAFYSGSIWTGATFQLHFAYRSADKLTLVGTVKEVDPDTLAETPVGKVRVHFESTNIVQLFEATKSDPNGGYIVFLTTGSNYAIAGSNELTCKVYELVRLDTFTDHTDIILKVPDGCLVPETMTGPGELLDDVLNREIGYHDYEPVKTAQVIRSTDVYRNPSNAGVALPVAIGDTVTLIDTTLTGALAIDSILVSATGDGEFRFLIDNTEVVPRRLINEDVPADDMMNGGVLYANVNQRLRVMVENKTSGSSANSINAQATIIGRNLG